MARFFSELADDAMQSAPPAHDFESNMYMRHTSDNYTLFD